MPDELASRSTTPENWDGKFRKIQISTGEKGFKVYARKGYYAKPPAASVAVTQ